MAANQPTLVNHVILLAQVSPGVPHPSERYSLMGKNAIVMKSKQIVCDILGLVLDMEMEMRLSRFVAAFNRGEFKAEGGRSHPELTLATNTEWEALVEARWVCFAHVTTPRLLCLATRPPTHHIPTILTHPTPTPYAGAVGVRCGLRNLASCQFTQSGGHMNARWF